MSAKLYWYLNYTEFEEIFTDFSKRKIENCFQMFKTFINQNYDSGEYKL